MGRIVTGLILIAAWLLLLYKGGFPLFCLIITAGCGIGLYEFLRMSSQQEKSKHVFPLLAIGILPLLGVSFGGASGMLSALFLAFLLLIIFTVLVYPTLDNALLFIGIQWFGIFYIGFCSAHLILMYIFPNGIFWLVFLTAITVFSDTAAYYTGRRFGKTKLYAALSPGKTWEGAAGGVLGGMTGGLLVAAFLNDGVGLVSIGILSLLLSIIGIIGDLAESLIKRLSGVKDSGSILPGHGGLLDRCDSILLTAPVLYYVLYWGYSLLLK